jgi:hypothetical protein
MNKHKKVLDLLHVKENKTRKMKEEKWSTNLFLKHTLEIFLDANDNKISSQTWMSSSFQSMSTCSAQYTTFSHEI